MHITQLLVQAIQEQDPPGRFLERAEDEHMWIEIHGQRLTDKVYRALRGDHFSINMKRTSTSSRTASQDRRQQQQQPDILTAATFTTPSLRRYSSTSSTNRRKEEWKEHEEEEVAAAKVSLTELRRTVSENTTEEKKEEYLDDVTTRWTRISKQNKKHVWVQTKGQKQGQRIPARPKSVRPSQQQGNRQGQQELPPYIKAALDSAESEAAASSFSTPLLNSMGPNDTDFVPPPSSLRSSVSWPLPRQGKSIAAHGQRSRLKVATEWKDSSSSSSFSVVDGGGTAADGDGTSMQTDDDDDMNVDDIVEDFLSAGRDDTSKTINYLRRQQDQRSSVIHNNENGNNLYHCRRQYEMAVKKEDIRTAVNTECEALQQLLDEEHANLALDILERQDKEKQQYKMFSHNKRRKSATAEAGDTPNGKSRNGDVVLPNEVVSTDPSNEVAGTGRDGDVATTSRDSLSSETISAETAPESLLPEEETTKLLEKLFEKQLLNTMNKIETLGTLNAELEVALRKVKTMNRLNKLLDSTINQARGAISFASNTITEALGEHGSLKGNMNVHMLKEQKEKGTRSSSTTNGPSSASTEKVILEKITTTLSRTKKALTEQLRWQQEEQQEKASTFISTTKDPPKKRKRWEEGTSSQKSQEKVSNFSLSANGLSLLAETPKRKHDVHQKFSRNGYRNNDVQMIERSKNTVDGDGYSYDDDVVNSDDSDEEDVLVF